MSFRYCCAFFAICLTTAFAQAQQAPTPEVVPPPSTPARTDPDKRGARPLTPAEERERAIRRYDPRSGADPREREQDTGLLTPRQDAQAPPRLNQRTLPAPRPLPGSVAASGQSDFIRPRSKGPEVIDPSQPDSAEPEYNGPSVLSRSYTLSRPNIPQEIKWTPSLAVSEIFASGTTGIPSTDGTSVARTTPATWATTVTWGFSGRHLWKRDQISSSYHGSATQSAGGQAYNGGNHSLDVQYGHVVSRHLITSLSQSLSTTSQSQSLQAGLQPSSNSVADSNLALSPGVQPIDQGMRQMSTLANLQWQKSSRMSISLGGGVFFTDRKGVVVSGTTGYSAQSDLTYRYSRKMTVGGYYSHTTYVFTKHISVSNSDTFGGIFSYAFNRSTQFRLRAGSSLVETQTLAFVPFPTQIALILGQAGGIAVQASRSRLQDISAEFARDLGRRRTSSISYAKGLAPGNGVLLTSSRETLKGTFSTTLPWGLRGNVSGGGDRLSAVGSSAGSFSSRFLQVSVSRAHSHGLSSSYAVDFRSFNTFATAAQQQQLRISTSVSWGPGENRLWK